MYHNLQEVPLQSFQIQDLKDFMKKLLILDTFDTFLVSEVTVTTFATFHVDGSFHADYFSDAETETLPAEQSGYALWKRVRPFFWELIKGKNTPLSFQIVFRLAPHNVESLIRQSGLSIQPSDVDGLFLNMRYDGSSLNCISGASLRIFTLDKSLEHAWDEMLGRFFKKKAIPVR